MPCQRRRSRRRCRFTRAKFLLSALAAVALLLTFYDTSTLPELAPCRSQKCLIVNCVSGFGNRARALLSAMVLAQAMNRHLIIVWMNDIHTQSKLEDLLATNVSTLDREVESFLPVSDTIFYDFDVVDNTPIQPTNLRYIYIRTAFRIELENMKMDHFMRQYHQFAAQLVPSAEVQHIIKRLWFEIGSRQNINTGAHIRMLQDQATDIPGLSTASQLERHMKDNVIPRAECQRGRCHVRNFYDTFKIMAMKRTDLHFWVSSDSKEAWDFLHGSSMKAQIDLTNAVAFSYCLDDGRRSLRCTQEAVAEIFVLSKMDVFVYSEWSSFSDLVLVLRRASGIKQEKDLPSQVSGCARKECPKPALR